MPRWADFSGAALDEKGGEVTVVEVAVLDGDDGLVQEGDFWETGTGVGGDRDLWCGVGCNGCFAATGGGGCDFEG